MIYLTKLIWEQVMRYNQTVKLVDICLTLSLLIVIMFATAIVYDETNRRIK